MFVHEGELRFSMSETPATKIEVDATGREFRMEVIDDVTAGILRKMTVEQRLEAADRLTQDLREYLVGTIRHLHPDWDELQIQAEVRRRFSHDAA